MTTQRSPRTRQPPSDTQQAVDPGLLVREDLRPALEKLFTKEELDLLWNDCLVVFTAGNITAPDLALMVRFAALEFLHKNIDEYRARQSGREAELEGLLTEAREKIQRYNALLGATAPRQPQAAAPPPAIDNAIIMQHLELTQRAQIEILHRLNQLEGRPDAGPHSGDTSVPGEATNSREPTGEGR